MSKIDDTTFMAAGKAALDAISEHTTDKLELLIILRALHNTVAESIEEDLLLMEADNGTAH